MCFQEASTASATTASSEMATAPPISPRSESYSGSKRQVQIKAMTNASGAQMTNPEHSQSLVRAAADGWSSSMRSTQYSNQERHLSGRGPPHDIRAQYNAKCSLNCKPYGARPNNPVQVHDINGPRVAEPYARQRISSENLRKPC
jgi:hypothetical protein